MSFRALDDNDLLSSYLFDLPPELVAQHPAAERDGSRLMLLPAEGETEEHIFAELADLLQPGDLLVRNNVRVLPARLLGKRRGGGAAELLLVRRDDSETGAERWLCMARPANRFAPGREFVFGENDDLIATARERGDDGMVWTTFSRKGLDFLAALETFGQVPLPPYIARPGKRPDPEDAARYQTLYASRPGAVAAPTAGLHFTGELDERLRARGIAVAEITLNVGPGTFRPIKTERLRDHHMHAEWYDIPASTWEQVHETKQRGGRVVAVGTTSARTLESAAESAQLSGWTDIFIKPGYRWKIVDGMVTNFHLPGSSLIVMISALAGRERVLSCYRRAVAEGWRFYSYGDAMLVWRAEER